MKLKIQLHTVLWICCLIGLYQQADVCPEQCGCSRERWNCGEMNITNSILMNISLNLDPATRKWDLKKNLITEFPPSAFVGFTNLEEIDLGENFLTKPPKNISQFIPSLKTLKLNKNRISSITKEDFQEYSSVNQLDLFGNYINELEPNTLEQLPELNKFFAEVNSLKILKKGIFAGLPKLIWVTFARNQIETISPGIFDNTLKLERVWLGNNKLTSLPDGLFNSSKELFILELKNNQLVNDGIPPNTFHAEELDLRGNNLTTLKKEWFDVIKYEVKVNDNPIYCDCTLYETYRVLMSRTTKKKYFEIIGKCASPPHLKGKSIKDFYVNNLVNCTACSLNKCQNSATCHEVDSGTYTCNCTTDKYYGKFCENENYCYMSPCVNNGTCSNTNTAFTCACEEGFIGERCEIEQPCFFNNPCLNNGTCIYLNGTFNHMCTCMDGFSGKNCQIYQDDDDDDGLAPGYIVLIVLIVLAFVAVLAVYLYKKRNASDKATVAENTPLSGNAHA